MQLSRISRLVVLGIPTLLLLMGPWYYLSTYLAAPVISLASELLQLLFPWVERVEIHGAIGTLITKLRVTVLQGNKLAIAQMTPEANYRTFGYGTVLLWTLLITSRPKHFLAKLALGTLALVPLQAISMCFQWLKDTVISGGTDILAQTGMSQWSLEAIAYGYQFGFLVLTPLAPAVLWLLLDNVFFKALWVEWTLTGSMSGSYRTKQ